VTWDVLSRHRAPRDGSWYKRSRERNLERGTWKEEFGKYGMVCAGQRERERERERGGRRRRGERRTQKKRGL
jgi:hypothetical protein